jgi:hypothetical protein
MTKARYTPRIISIEEGDELIRQGYFALDAHCHSSYSFDVPDAKDTSPENVIRQQQFRGLNPILTDHDTLDGYNYLRLKDIKHKRHDRNKIIPAVELTFKPKIARKILSYKSIQTLHINIFGLNDKDLQFLKEIAKRGDLDELVRYLKKNNLDWMYNHPFYHEKKERLNWRVIPELAKNYFDVVELNSSYSKGLNDITQKVAENLHKGIVASSDSHTGNPGRGIVIAEGKNFKEFWKNVKSGNSYIVRKDMGVWNIVIEASRIINQAFKARLRPRAGRAYTPATSFQPFDNLMKSITSGKLKSRFIVRNLVHMLLQGANFIAVPILAWRLHVTKDEEKAQRIRKRMQVITTNIIILKRNIKPIKSKNIIKPKYYGANFVENRKIRQF